MKQTSIRLRVAAVIVGLIAAFVPVAMLAYDVAADATTHQAVAQATATATAQPSEETGPGIIDQSGSLAVAALLVVLAIGVVAGGRVLSTRRSI